MVVLGLGANIGDRPAQLARAVRALVDPARKCFDALVVSPLYESDAMLLPGSPPEWGMPFLNLAVSGTTSLAPHDLLIAIKNLEQELGRRERERWAPREIDIDILAWPGITMKSTDLTIPHPGLCERPFAALPAADVVGRFPGPEPELFNWWIQSRTPSEAMRAPSGTVLAANAMQRRFRALLAGCSSVEVVHGSRPELVGILNVTPDSFSDGGRYLRADEAAERASDLITAGATVIDVGAESTRPGAEPIGAGEELRRLLPVVRALQDRRPAGVRISLDSRNPEVVERMLEEGIDWVNDVTGFEDRRMLELAKESACDVVCMHHLGVPPRRDATLARDRSATIQVREWFEQRLERFSRAGIPPERIIFDPGIGFGKTPQQNFELISGAATCVVEGTRLLLGHSRKSFLSVVTDRPAAERDLESAVLSVVLAGRGVDYIRLHDVESTTRAMRAQAAVEAPAAFRVPGNTP